MADTDAGGSNLKEQVDSALELTGARSGAGYLIDKAMTALRVAEPLRDLRHLLVSKLGADGAAYREKMESGLALLGLTAEGNLFEKAI